MRRNDRSHSPKYAAMSETDLERRLFGSCVGATGTGAAAADQRHDRHEL
jgi:hypothetical protein